MILLEGRAYWDPRAKNPYFQVILEHVAHCRWDMIAPMDWEYLAGTEHQCLVEEDVQLIAVTQDSEVFKHLTNPSEKVRRLHAMRWKI